MGWHWQQEREEKFGSICCAVTQPRRGRRIKRGGKKAKLQYFRGGQIARRVLLNLKSVKGFEKLTLTIWRPNSSSSGLLHSLKHVRSALFQSTPLLVRYLSASVNHNFLRNSVGTPSGRRATIFIASFHWL